VVIGLVVLALVALGGWWLGRGSVPDYAARVDSLQVVADSLRGVASRQRAATDTIVLRVREAGHRAADANLALGTALDSARQAAADSNATVGTLRVALSEVVARAEQYRAEVLTYEAQVDTLVRAHLAERQATAQQVEAMEAVIGGQARALRAGRCSTFFGRCPTRWQAFVWGAITAAVVVGL
jgi:hypothetical protein